MNPYDTLGVPKDCTRDELKEAFRAQAQRAHPDRGGEPAAFIRLRQAFDQISDELDRRPPVSKSEARKRAPRPDRRPTAPDPNWDPDLIVLDEPLTRTRPPRPRDPSWEPELVLVDDGPEPAQRPPSRDPGLARQNYIGWLRRSSFRTSATDRAPQTSGWNPTGVIGLLIAIFLTVWICWAALRNEPATETFDVKTKYDPMRATE